MNSLLFTVLSYIAGFFAIIACINVIALLIVCILENKEKK